MGTFSVVASGFESARLEAHPAHESIHTVVDATDEQFYEQGREVLERCDPDQPVLVVHAGQPGHARRVGVLRAMSRRHQVVPVGFALPPTGLSARATWLATLSERRISAGLAIAHLRLHGRVLPTIAVVSSVAGLSVPGVTLGQHAMSWLPGTWFGLTFEDGNRFGTRQVPELDLLDEDYDRVVSGDPQRIAGRPIELPDVVDTWELPEVAEPSRWWGRARYFEQTLIPRDPLGVIRLISEQRFGRCPECGSVAAGACSFCSAREEIAS